jgi:replicative DNA helicase
MNNIVPYPAANTRAETDLSPPYNEQAEREMLGALLLDNRVMDQIGDFLRPEHFYIPSHQRIYTAIERLINKGQMASPTTLKGYFAADGDLSHVGGAEYLEGLKSAVTTTIGMNDIGGAIYDLFLRRELLTIGQQVIQDARPSMTQVGIEATTLIEQAEARLFNLVTAGDSERGFVSFNKALSTSLSIVEKAYQSDGHIVGLTSGFKDINKRMGGLHPSDLIIIAGRPSMGKTALVTDIAFNAAREYVRSNKKSGAPVAFFSLEMSTEQLATRILSSAARIPSDRMRRGEIRKEEMLQLSMAARDISEVPLFIDDTPAMSVMGIRTRARRLKRQHGLGLIVVDYLQLMSGSGSRSNQENRVQEVSEITRGLKAIAKELDVPVIALSQLSRQTENRDNKTPQLSDLRESGSIEQDADVVIFVYREEYYLSREEPKRKTDETDGKFNERYARWQALLAEKQNIAEAIIAKQRHGPIGTVKLRFDGQFTHFEDLETGGFE